MNVYTGGAFWSREFGLVAEQSEQARARKNDPAWQKETARKQTIAWPILAAHNTNPDPESDALQIRFDSITSHDITYVGIIQTAIASGMEQFPLPYVLTCCHNSLCAVGGTINEDDHKFALSAARKFGGIYVPPNLAVIHNYNREVMTGCGRMILGSDSHTRYGALGTLAIGEGGGELAKQLLGQTYDIKRPEVVAVYLHGQIRHGVGPHDIALQMVRALFDSGYAKNKILEFIGPGIAPLSVEFRNGIDVMTTETTCLSSIWATDDKVHDYLTMHGRTEAYRELQPGAVAYYDGAVDLDLSAVRPSIALPFHPSNVWTIADLQANPREILHQTQQTAQELFSGTDIRVDLMSRIRDGKIYIDQGIVVGCSGGTFDNIEAVRDIMAHGNPGAGVFNLIIYPGSQPIYLDLVRKGIVGDLMAAGATVKPAFCGPCFGAGDTPANGELSLRHATRNFPNRDGSNPNAGQLTLVALADARSIAATALNQGFLTSAEDVDFTLASQPYHYDPAIYAKRVFNGYGHPEAELSLALGPNIRPWPQMPALTTDLLLKVVSHIDDPVTSTDELIPSGETSSYRSNPERLAEFTLSRRDPGYVPAAKAVRALEQERIAGRDPASSEELAAVRQKLEAAGIVRDSRPLDLLQTEIGSAIFARRPGDGSAREQAASCQRVLGGAANFAIEYATKRYRSNLINWGIIPFLIDSAADVSKGDYVYLRNIRDYVLGKTDQAEAWVIGETVRPIRLRIGEMNMRERQILAAGSLINRNREERIG